MGLEAQIVREIQRTNQLLEHLAKQNAALYELLAVRLPEPAVAGRPTPPWQQPAT